MGQLLGLILEYQEAMSKEPMYLDGQVNRDINKEAKCDLFTFICNKLEKYSPFFTFRDGLHVKTGLL